MTAAVLVLCLTYARQQSVLDTLAGYCFLGCFWKPVFSAIGSFFRHNWGNILSMAAGAACTPLGLAPVCAGLVSAAVAGITSGNLGLALRAGFLTAVTVGSFQAIGELTAGNLVAKIMAHGAVGCMTAMASGGKCGSGALSAAAGAAATPLGLIGASVAGGLVSVATGGKFGNGAITAAFGYLFNACGKDPWGCLKLGTATGLVVGTYLGAAEIVGTGTLGTPLAPLIVGGTTLIYATAGAAIDVGAMIYDSLPSSSSGQYNTDNSRMTPDQEAC